MSAPKPTDFKDIRGVPVEPNARQLAKLRGLAKSEPTLLVLDQTKNGQILCSIRARFVRSRFVEARSILIENDGRLSEYDPF